MLVVIDLLGGAACQTVFLNSCSHVSSFSNSGNLVTWWTLEKRLVFFAKGSQCGLSDMPIIHQCLTTLGLHSIGDLASQVSTMT
jgi:hypothetical protein